MKELIENEIKYVVILYNIQVEIIGEADSFSLQPRTLIPTDIYRLYLSDEKELTKTLKAYRDVHKELLKFCNGPITLQQGESSVMWNDWYITEILDTHGHNVEVCQKTRVKKIIRKKYNWNRYYRSISYKQHKLSICMGKYEQDLLLKEHSCKLKLRLRADYIDAWDGYPRGDYRDNCWKRKKIKKQYMKHSV